MKKIIALLLTTTFLLIPLDGIAYAKNNEAEDKKQQLIDNIFNEINMAALEEKNIKLLNDNGILTGTSTKNQIKEIRGKINRLDSELEKLNVHKMDPANINDMKKLKELSTSSYVNQNSLQVYAATPPAPDLSAFASLYSIYLYDGTYLFNDTNTYIPYRYIRVIDNKGYNGLYFSNITVPFPNGQTPSVLKSYVNYTIRFVTSQFYGSLGIPALANYTMGSIWSILNAPDAIISYSSSSNLLTMLSDSLTQMVYIYAYDSSLGWKHIGTRADFSYKRTDNIMCNLSGTLVNENKKYETSGSTGWGIYDYISGWAKIKNNYPDYCTIHPIGSYSVQGVSSSTTFTPKFRTYPNELLYQ